MRKIRLTLSLATALQKAKHFHQFLGKLRKKSYRSIHISK
jgi:hypothetical protein